MSYNRKNIITLLELHKKLLEETKERLGNSGNDFMVEHTNSGAEHDRPSDCDLENQKQEFDKKQFKNSLKNVVVEDTQAERPSKNFPLVEPLDLSSCNGSFEKDKQAFIDKLENSENPLTFRSDDSSGEGAMLRYGEFSPNNPQLRVTAAPYIGLGEYDQRRHLILKQRQADYKEYILKKNNLFKNTVNNYLDHSIPEEQPKSIGVSKGVQTDIQNIHSKIVQYELHSENPPEKELSPQPVKKNFDSMMHGNRNSSSGRSDARSLRSDSVKPKSILSTRRTDAHRDVHRSYVPSILDGFNYQDREELAERERLKREVYQADLKQQIEEKRRVLILKEAQERREQELENRRFEQQLLRMQEDPYRDDLYSKQKLSTFRRTSEDLKSYRDEPFESSFRKHADSESSVTNFRNTKAASKNLPHYSPPVSRRVPYSFNIPSTSVFSNPTNRYNPSYYDMYKRDNYTRRNCFSRSESVNREESRSRSNSFNRHDHVLNRHESLSRIDSLQRQEALNRLETLSIRDGYGGSSRRHSATQQELNLMRSPKSYRYDRGSCSKLDDTLPIPILKAHSPVAKDLKNSVAIDSSRHSSEALRKLEDRWQIPAVQKNIISHCDPLREGHGRSTLTQLGAIRLQLQKEQLRMDEMLRKRASSHQPKAV